MTTPRPFDDRLDPQVIEQETFVRHVQLHQQLPSTNDRALELLAAGRAPKEPFLVLAERQWAGRGRGRNAWWSSPGALTFSLVVDRPAVETPGGPWSRVALLTGWAIGRTLAPLLPGHVIRLKWPNDVYLNQKKVSGILVETSPSQPEWLVIGVGINVNNSLADSPLEIRRRGTSLVDAFGRCFPRGVLLRGFLQQWQRCLAEARQSDFSLARQWQPWCLLTGQRVEVSTADRETRGVCRGIDDAGALLLMTDEGLQRCYAGVVTLLPA